MSTYCLNTTNVNVTGLVQMISKFNNWLQPGDFAPPTWIDIGRTLTPFGFWGILFFACLVFLVYTGTVSKVIKILAYLMKSALLSMVQGLREEGIGLAPVGRIAPTRQ